MANVSVNNEIDDIIDELAATLLAGTWTDDESSVFDLVEKAASIQTFKDSRMTQSPCAAVVLNGMEDHLITDNRRGCVADLAIFIASMEDVETDRVTDIGKLVAAAKNLINADVPDDAEGFFQDGEENMTPRLEWGEPDSDTESDVPWQFTELPLRVAFVTAGDTSY